MNCERFEQLLDAEGPAGLTAAAQAHADTCPRCARALAAARSMDLMNPAGFPFLAGRILILRGSPGFIEVLLIPCRVRFCTEAVVRIQSVVVPSGFGTVSSMLTCGFVKCSCLSVPCRTISLFRS